ncbi:MAG: TonB-dependent receptor [Chlorobiaceae bacterium]
MNKSVFFIVMAGLLSSKGVLAAEQANSFTGEEMVVTATKTLNRISDAGGSSITVITSEEIAASGQNTIEEVIRGSVGIDVKSSGGTGSKASVFLRGGDSKNTLLLIDGIPANDPSDPNRAPDFANFTVDNIDRIEIVRGPVSVLYGSNATAGVINIITKKGSATPESYAGIEGGSYHTWKTYAGTRGKKDALSYSIGIARLKSDGFSIADNRNNRIPHAGNTSERDGYQNTSLSANLGYELSSHVALETVLRNINSTVKLDEYLWAGYAGDRLDANPDGPKESHSTSKMLSGRVALKIDTKPLLSTFYYNLSNQKRTNFDNENIQTDLYNGDIHEAGWQGDLQVLSGNTLTSAISYQNEHASATNAFSLLDKSAGMSSVFVQDRWKLDGATLLGAVRHDDHETFGGHTTWRFAPSYAIENTTLKASYGTGFRAPSLVELYDATYGNINLKPETSRGWDAGVQQIASKQLQFGATWFATDYNDRIGYDPSTYQSIQVPGMTHTSGVESFAEWKADEKLLLTASYTYTHTEDPDGNQLILRPKHKANLNAAWKINDKSKLSTSMQWVGERKAIPGIYGDFDKDGNPVGTLGSYVLVNLAASCKVADHVELYGRIDNVFDTWYEDAWSYATAGRSAYGGVKVIF